MFIKISPAKPVHPANVFKLSLSLLGMKKEKFVLMLFIITLLSITFVSAQIQQSIADTVVGVGNTFVSVFGPILGADTGSDLIFARISFLIITFIMVFLALDNIDIFEGNKAARVTIAGIKTLETIQKEND